MTAIQTNDGILPSLVVFAHGKESGPWGRKIKRLAEIAERFGANVLSPDYRDLDSPDERVARLLALGLPPHGVLVLVGSSMGGYVSTVASGRLRPKGLFLLAPAFGLAGYDIPVPAPCANHLFIVHGWQDEIIPAHSSIAFAERHRAEIHVLDDDHRLTARISEIGVLFEHFLIRCLDASAASTGADR